jgi:Zn-dependent M28 family amino/carboxypeptidase
VMLVNDPGFATRDPALFRGRTMTFYGRWTYKYQIGSEKGAAGVLVVHDTEAAGYPWTVVDNSWGSENFHIRSADGNAGRIALSGWITGDYARELFSAAGQDFEALKTAASRRDFKPVALGKARFKVRNSTREVDSRNVVARLPGRERPDEHIVYTAHWDHLGRDENLEGDPIYNGALDNATGTAGLIALARAYKALPRPPRRSVLFLAVTAEEQGLLGAQRYAAEPLYPLEKTLANFNMDALNPWGRTRDVEVIGWGQSTLEDLLREEAGKQGRVLAPEAEPEKGYYYRSDHFEFAKRGVPALYAKSGIEFIGQPPDYGERRRAEYRAQAYHGVADEVQPDWDLSGMVEDLQLYFAVGHRVTEGDTWPQWKTGSEFRAIREARLAQ